MTYLLTQMIFSLALAALFGGAVGWLINGYRAANRQDQNKSELMRLSLALSQAETDNKMIEDDFRELKSRAEESAALYREEARQIPELKNNLEKSQTLVRQLLQKHEAELRQLSAENSVLNSKMRELENREKAVTRLQMELNTERLKMRKDKHVATDTDKGASVVSTAAEAASTESGLAELSGLTQQTEIPLDTHESRAANEPVSTESSIDDILEKADHVLTRFQQDPGRELDTFQMELDQELDAIRHDLATDTNLDELPLLQKRIPQKRPADAVADLPDIAAENAPTFLPATGKDALQEIFGIGPVTENTLNSIGITSFEQIAHFKREHIEYVAEVLQIFPGRIERDNWVASASKLVENRSLQPDPTDSPSPELEDA